MKNLSRPLTAATLFAALALTACSAQDAGNAPSSSAPETAAAAATPSPSRSSGPFGDFPSAAEACTAISQQAAAASLFPLSAAQGKTAELEQLKAELSETADRAPDELKADFANLNEVAVSGLSDQTVYSSGKFDAAMTPVAAWLNANCK